MLCKRRRRGRAGAVFDDRAFFFAVPFYLIADPTPLALVQTAVGDLLNRSRKPANGNASRSAHGLPVCPSRNLGNLPGWRVSDSGASVFFFCTCFLSSRRNLHGQHEVTGRKGFPPPPKSAARRKVFARRRCRRTISPRG